MGACAAARKPLRTRLRLVVSTLPRRLPWLLLLLLLLCGIWALLVHTSRTPASDLAHSSSGAQQVSSPGKPTSHTSPLDSLPRLILAATAAPCYPTSPWGFYPTCTAGARLASERLSAAGAEGFGRAETAPP